MSTGAEGATSIVPFVAGKIVWRRCAPAEALAISHGRTEDDQQPAPHRIIVDGSQD
jgi:hypothetical protein